MSGFVYTQTLLACEQFGWLESLAQSPQPAEQLISASGLSRERGLLLVKAACGIGLMSLRRGRVRLTLRGEVIASQAGLRALIRHHALFYQDLMDPSALLRETSPRTRLRQFWAYVDRRDGEGGGSEAQAAEYSALMTVTQDMVVSQVLASVNLRESKGLLDLGGGQGRFVHEIAKRYPGLGVHVFDLPGVQTPAAFGHIGRTVGDFFRDEFPTGFDTISLVRVLYDHPDEWVIRLLTKVHQYLAPIKGRLLVAEPMAEAQRQIPMAEAYFGWYLLAMKGGRARSQAELSGLLRQVGFRTVATPRTPVPMQCSVIQAWA